MSIFAKSILQLLSLFIRNYYRIYNWQKSCDRSIFSLQPVSQLFCQLRTLPKININWKWRFSTKDKCIEKDDFLLKTHFVWLYNVFISQKVITIPSLYPPLKYILSFYPQMRCRNSFIWIFALDFHCIHNYDRIRNWQKSCDGSIFSLHILIFVS